VPCVQGRLPIHHRVERLDGDLLLVWSDAEGAAVVEIATWTPERGQETLLLVDLGLQGSFEIRRKGEAYEIVTGCLPDGCGTGEPPPARTWRWSRDGGLVPPR
jgi:hypothetical protein